MPSDDLAINVRQISGYPFQVYAGYGDAVVLQAAGPTGSSLNGPYVSMSIQGAVASALSVDQTRGLGVGAPLPLGAGGNVLASQGFVAPVNKGVLFNCFAGEGAPWGALTYLVSDIAGAMLFTDAGFSFLGFPAGQSLTPVMAGATAAVLSRTGTLSLREQVVVGRDPIGPNEAVTLSYFTLHAIVRDPNNGKLNLTTEDIVNAGGATQWNAALAGYPTAQTPVPEASANEIVTAEWARNILVAGFNGRHGEICLTVEDITWAGGAPAFSPHLIGEPLAPTPPFDDDSDRIATTKMVQEAIDAVGTLTGPPGPVGPQGPEGPPGTGINFLGTVPTFADLPASGNSVGDMYITQDENDGYIWEEPGGWTLIGMITPQTMVLVSVTPPALPTQGDLWWDNTTAQLMLYYAGNWVVANLGAIGPQGPPGVQGDTGPQGPQGATGGANAPVSSTPPANPNAGDFWWNTLQGQLMVFVGGTWVPAAAGGAASAAIGGTQSVPMNSIVPTGWGYALGAAGNQGASGGPYGNFFSICQPEIGFPPGNIGSVLGDGQNAYLYGTQVNAWNNSGINTNRPILTRLITGLPQPVPRASIQVNAGAVMPQGFYYGGQLTNNQGYVTYPPSGSPNKFPSASVELFYSDGINFLCNGNVIGSTATFIPVGVSGLNNGVIGPTVTFAQGSLVPAGVWYCFETANNAQNNAALVLLPGATNSDPSPLNPLLNFMFFSDGTYILVDQGPIELNQVIFS